MRADTVVGYVYQADQFHPSCLYGVPWRVEVGEVEHALDRWAALDGVNRADESSFDSDDFPKVIFADQAEGVCGRCGEPLIEGDE